MEENISKTKKIIICGIFLAISLVVGRFRIVIPGFCRITFNGPFYKFIALVFGPLHGAIVSFLTESIGVLMNPVGNYIWMFSVVACIKGFLIGLLWKICSMKKVNWSKFKFYCVLAFSVGIPDLLTSFLNTLIMRSYLLLPKKTFFVILVLRLCKESLLIVLNVIILAVMINIYEKIVGGTKGDA